MINSNDDILFRKRRRIMMEHRYKILAHPVISNSSSCGKKCLRVTKDILIAFGIYLTTT